MGACRETKNIFLYIRYNDWRKVFYLIKRFDKLTYDDTFMPIVCKLKRHIPYQPDKEYEPNEWACKRCHRWISYGLKEQRQEKLRKLKKPSIWY